MPSTWAYRATKTRAKRAETLALLVEDGFLCRTAFARTSDGRRQFIRHVSRIEPGDELHVYYADGAEPLRLAGFQVLAPTAPLAGLSDEAPALAIVGEGEALASRLEACGYARDPVLQRFTGFSLAPLDEAVEPTEAPRFVGRNAIVALSDGVARHGPSETPTPLLPAPTSIGSLNGLVYGVDWSGARRAGDKIWVATLDPAERAVLEVDRPWRGLGPEEAARAVAGWIGDLQDAWVGIDAPFGLAASDRMALIGEVEADPRRWSKALVERLPDRHAFIDAVIDANLIGRHRRRTDKLARSPFAPTLLQMIHQTYAALQLLSQLDRTQVQILPWDSGRTAGVSVLETCPAVLLKALGLSNHGYKLKPGSNIRRRHLVEQAAERLGWHIDDTIRQRVEQDKEGDVLDAILCGMVTARSAAADHAVPPGDAMALEEGWIYV